MDRSDAPESARDAMAIPRGVAYLNCAYMGPLPRAAVEAGWVALDRKARPWTIPGDDFFVPVEQYRAAVADLLDADADGVAVTPAVSFGLSSFAAQLRLAPGDVVVVPDEEFPSNLLPWQAVAVAAGATVQRAAPAPDGDRHRGLLDVIDALGERVALVAAAPCHWTDGQTFDLVEIGARARAVGAALAVDVTQWLGAAPFSVADCRPDVVVGATYKWLLGPYSLGFAWFGPPWREGTPLDHPWSVREGAEDFARLTTPSPRLRPGARRYDVGETAQHLQMPVALAALGVVADWGPERTAAHAAAATARIVDAALGLGLAVGPASRRSPHLVGLDLTPRRVDPAPVAAALADAGVHVSVRGSSLRVSVHRFVDDDDVDRLLSTLGPALDASR